MGANGERYWGVADYNSYFLSKLRGETREYVARDNGSEPLEELDEDEEEKEGALTETVRSQESAEDIQSLDRSSPPRLLLKLVCTVMCTKNISKGLRNGTR